MAVKRIIGFFLILVFTIPVLPLSEVGALLGSNLLTEEISHANADGPLKLAEKEIHSSIFSLSVAQDGFNLETKWEKDERFISRQVDDVQTPPPNM
jgi:hypothetical protein